MTYQVYEPVSPEQLALFQPISVSYSSGTSYTFSSSSSSPENGSGGSSSPSSSNGPAGSYQSNSASSSLPSGMSSYGQTMFFGSVPPHVLPPGYELIYIGVSDLTAENVYEVVGPPQSSNNAPPVVMAVIPAPDDNEEISADDGGTVLAAMVFVQQTDGTYVPADDGTVVSWTSSSGQLDSAVSTTVAGVALVGLTTGTTPGQNFTVQASIADLLYNSQSYTQPSDSWTASSATLTVVPGAPASVTLHSDRSSYPADGTTTETITLNAFDQFHNPVGDNNVVDWSTSGDAVLLPGSRSTTGGECVGEFTSGVSGRPSAITAIVGDVSQTISMNEVVPQLTLTSSHSSLDISQNQSTTVTVTATSSAGAPADGTPVYWYSTGGTITATSQLSGGTATATLTATSNQEGDNGVFAVVGTGLGTLPITFTSSGAVHVSVGQPLVASDLLESQNVTFTGVNGQPITEYCPARADFTIQGPPGEYQIDVSDNTGYSSTQVVELEQQPNSSESSAKGYVSYEGNQPITFVYIIHLHGPTPTPTPTPTPHPPGTLSPGITTVKVTNLSSSSSESITVAHAESKIVAEAESLADQVENIQNNSSSGSSARVTTGTIKKWLGDAIGTVTSAVIDFTPLGDIKSATTLIGKLAEGQSLTVAEEVQLTGSILAIGTTLLAPEIAEPLKAFGAVYKGIKAYKSSTQQVSKIMFSYTKKLLTKQSVTDEEKAGADLVEYISKKDSKYLDNFGKATNISQDSVQKLAKLNKIGGNEVTDKIVEIASHSPVNADKVIHTMSQLEETTLKKLKPDDYENLAKAIGSEDLAPTQLADCIKVTERYADPAYQTKDLLKDLAIVREGNPTAKLKKTILKNIAGQFPNIAKPKAVKGYLSELRTAATAGEKQEAAFTSDVMESMGLDVLTKSKVVNCKYQFNTLVHAAGKKLEKLKLKLSASADRNTINYLAWSYREAQKVAPGKQYVLSFGHLSPDERTALNKILLRLSSPPYNMNITYIEQHL